MLAPDLPKKLGVREGASIWLAGAPPGFASDLRRALPTGASVEMRRPPGPVDLIVWWPRSPSEATGRFGSIKESLGARGAVWVVLPREGRHEPARRSVDFECVQRAGLAAGLVEHKVLRLNEREYGIRFGQRTSGGPNGRAGEEDPGGT